MARKGTGRARETWILEYVLHNTLAISTLICQENQVATFRIPTTDGESLFGWLVAPLGVYKKNLDLFENEKASSDIEQRQAFRCLEQDPEARLLIYCKQGHSICY